MSKDKEDINRIKVVLVEKKLTNKWLAEQMGKAPATILFEPELALNLHDKISEWAKEKALIVKLEGNIVDDEFHFCESDTSQCKVSLRDIAYKTI